MVLSFHDLACVYSNQTSQNIKLWSIWRKLIVAFDLISNFISGYELHIIVIIKISRMILFFDFTEYAFVIVNCVVKQTCINNWSKNTHNWMKNVELFLRKFRHLRGNWSHERNFTSLIIHVFITFPIFFVPKKVIQPFRWNSAQLMYILYVTLQEYF